MKKTAIVSIFLLLMVFSQNLSAHQQNGIKVILTFKAKVESKNEFIDFLNKNVPNVRAFEGCSSVKIYFDNSTNEMIITENWSSKEHHNKYIKFISENGVMKDLVSYLQKEPSIKYYDILSI